MSIGSSRVNRIFPLKDTGYFLISSVKYFSSNFGNGAVDILSLLPNLLHSSSEICGAYGDWAIAGMDRNWS